ncbi:hypothetical protein OIU77_016203 [Salix suchowensis]|uniref:Uncharacterized protein n=1 Tax=Salix suchowensis TaxID=1278906 RepID=A0ABQ8ZJH6_9ROSI|nr:hypothetical protein OIU77_016203 [Salix suchowensis]
MIPPHPPASHSINHCLSPIINGGNCSITSSSAKIPPLGPVKYLPRETAAVGTHSKNTQPPSAPQFPIKTLMAGGGPRQRGAPAPPVGEKRQWVLGWAPGGEKDGFVLRKIGS